MSTLQKSGASKDGPPPAQRDVQSETANVLSTLLTLLPEELAVISADAPNGPRTPRHPLLKRVLEFSAGILADLVHARNFSDTQAWNRSLGLYVEPWFPAGSTDATKFAERVRAHFLAVDQEKHGGAVTGSSEEGELLCDTLFSLAYGALLLLSHTHLRL